MIKRIKVKIRKGVEIERAAKIGKVWTGRKAETGGGKTVEIEKDGVIKAEVVVEKEIETGKGKTTEKEVKIPKEEKAKREAIVRKKAKAENQTRKTAGIRRSEIELPVGTRGVTGIRRKVKTEKDVAKKRKEVKEAKVAIRRKTARDPVKIRKEKSLEIKRKEVKGLRVVVSLQEKRSVVDDLRVVENREVRRRSIKSRKGGSRVGRRKVAGHPGAECQEARKLTKAPRNYADLNTLLIRRIKVNNIS